MFKKKNKQLLLSEETEQEIQQEKEQKETIKEKKEIKKRDKKDIKDYFENKKTLGIALIILSLLMIFIIRPSINYVSTIGDTTIYIAVSDIEKGKEITRDMVDKMTVPKSSIADFLVVDISPVGQYAQTDIIKGEPISNVKVSATPPIKDEYIYKLENGKQAISVSLQKLATSVSAKVQKGDIVSVYFYLDGLEENQSYYGTLPEELRYVEVLNVTTEDGTESEEGYIPATVTLLVNEQQAKVLVGIEKNAAAHLSIVSRGNKEKAEELLNIQQQIIDGTYMQDENIDIDVDTTLDNKEEKE